MLRRFEVTIVFVVVYPQQIHTALFLELVFAKLARKRQKITISSCGSHTASILYNIAVAYSIFPFPYYRGPDNPRRLPFSDYIYFNAHKHFMDVYAISLLRVCNQGLSAAFICFFFFLSVVVLELPD